MEEGEDWQPTNHHSACFTWLSNERGALHQPYIAALPNQLQDPPSLFLHMHSECTSVYKLIFSSSFFFPPKHNDLKLLLIKLPSAASTLWCVHFNLSRISVMHFLVSFKRNNIVSQTISWPGRIARQQVETPGILLFPNKETVWCITAIFRMCFLYIFNKGNTS